MHPIWAPPKFPAPSAIWGLRLGADQKPIAFVQLYKAAVSWLQSPILGVLVLYSLQGAIPKSSAYRCHCSENHDCTVPQRGWATSILSIYIHAHPLLTALVIVLLPPNTAGTTIMMAAIVVLLQSSSPPPMWVRRTALPKVIDRREVALPCLPKPRSRRGEMKPH